MSYRDSRFLHVKDTLEMMAKFSRLEQHSTKGWPFSVRDNNAAKMSHVNCEWCEEKSR